MEEVKEEAPRQEQSPQQLKGSLIEDEDKEEEEDNEDVDGPDLNFNKDAGLCHGISSMRDPQENASNLEVFGVQRRPLESSPISAFLA